MKKSFENRAIDTKSIDFIAGTISNAAKEYWYKQFEKQKLEFAIEQLKSFDLELQKYELSSDVLIFNKLKELEQKLSEL